MINSMKNKKGIHFRCLFNIDKKPACMGITIFYRKKCIIQYINAPHAAESGIVSTHAQIIFPATPHLTAESRLTLPTPIIEPVIVCVVLTGIPNKAVRSNVVAPENSAANPPIGLSLVIFIPIVLTILQPPNIVPRPITV